MLDVCPAVPPNLAWNMRPREKDKEIGPQFRFKYRTQLQRMHDSFQNNVAYEFVDYDKVTPVISDQVQRFVKTGKI